MKMSYFETKKGRIELIPMIDVMFFLLIFFMILTLRMIPDQGLGLALPQASRAKTLPRPQVLIGLTANGAIHVQGRVVRRAALARLLARKAGVANIGIAAHRS